MTVKKLHCFRKKCVGKKNEMVSWIEKKKGLKFCFEKIIRFFENNGKTFFSQKLFYDVMFRFIQLSVASVGVLDNSVPETKSVKEEKDWEWCVWLSQVMGLLCEGEKRVKNGEFMLWLDAIVWLSLPLSFETVWMVHCWQVSWQKPTKMIVNKKWVLVVV